MDTAEQLRERGKALYFDPSADRVMRCEGFRLLQQSCLAGDPEAGYLVGRLALDKIIYPGSSDPQGYALGLICRAANRGYLPARVFLNGYCRDKDREKHSADLPVEGPLVDFDRKIIRINRQGVFTPVDAVLTYENGCNILTLRSNIQFLYSEEIPNRFAFERAVRRGIRSWEGEYTVFGGQRLTVRVELTDEEKLFDNLLVIPVTAGLTDVISSVSRLLPGQEPKQRLRSVTADKRSFAVLGRKWRASSRKFIYIQSRDGQFADDNEITHVAKHEFGHALGLGDLYASAVDALEGVEPGTYGELDSYLISGRFYNLVMCDHHGPISNNDIEMVILAFRENKMQHYQAGRFKGKISAALGKGN